jgi:predicted dehydrogenase
LSVKSEMEQTRIRLGLVGCGRVVAAGYAPALRGLEGVAVTAIAEPDARRRGQVGAQLSNGSRPAEFASAEELLGAGGVDALVIASPSDRHFRDAELASQAGVPTLVEKPPAPDFAGAARLAELERPPWIGFNRRFLHPGVRALGAAPAPLGGLDIELRINYLRRSWGAHSVRDDALLDLGPHLADLALLLLGADAEVRSARVAPEGAELELAGGCGVARISCATNRPYAERVVVRDADGRALAATRRGGPVRNLATRLPGAEHPLTASLRAQLAGFLAAVRGDLGAAPASAHDGARVMRVIDDARRFAA